MLSQRRRRRSINKSTPSQRGCHQKCLMLCISDARYMYSVASRCMIWTYMYRLRLLDTLTFFYFHILIMCRELLIITSPADVCAIPVLGL